MKTNQKFCHAIALVTVFLAGLASESAQAQAVTATFTNSFGDAIWERDAHIANLGNPADVSTPGNWSTGAYPTDHHKIQDPNTAVFIPNADPLYDVVIALPITCTLGNNVSVVIQTLNVAGVSTLGIAAGSTLAIANGQLVNNGSILVNTTAANSSTKVRFDGNGLITGTGTVTLNDPGNTFDRADVDLQTFTVTHGANHTIRGHGTIIGFGGGILINNGTIVGDSPSGFSLQLDLANTTNQNNATIKAINGGSVAMNGGTIDQTGGGTFLADGNGSLVQFYVSGNGTNVPTLIGGIVTTANGGIVEPGNPFNHAVIFQSVTNNGTIQIPTSDSIIVTGTGLTNNGTILVNTTGENNSTKLRFDANGTLGGTGSVTLNDPGNTFDRADVDLQTSTVTHGANHTIRGHGTIIGFNGATLINDGTIIGDSTSGFSLQLDLANTTNQNNGTMKATSGGLLGLYSGTMDQTGGGTFLADGNGSLIQLGGGGFSTVIGGILNTTNNGLIAANGTGAGLVGCTNNGTIQIPVGKFILVTNGLINNGSILVDPTGDTSATTLLRFDSNTQISGTGKVLLNGPAFNVADFTVNDNVTVANGSGHTLGGIGNIFIGGGSAVLTNNGIIAPGLSPGQLNVSGNLQLGSTSNLSIEVAGTTAATQYDVLNKTDGGTLTLNGTLTVRLLNGFVPANADNFSIVTTQTILAGAFTNVASGARLNTAD